MTLRLILGDQLNLKHSWFEKPDANTIYVLYELIAQARKLVSGWGGAVAPRVCDQNIELNFH